MSSDDAHSAGLSFFGIGLLLSDVAGCSEPISDSFCVPHCPHLLSYSATPMTAASSRFQSLRSTDAIRLFEALNNEGDGLLFQCSARSEISALTAVLANYYDRSSQHDFSDGLDHTEFVPHNAAGAGMFHVLQLDLSKIDDCHPADTLRQRLTAAFEDFFTRYPIPGWKALLAASSSESSPANLLLRFFNRVQPVIHHRLCVLIEGDGLIERTPSGSQQSSRIAPEKTVALTTFLVQLKRNTGKTRSVARIFMVGIPRVFSQTMTEVFSLVKDISSFPTFTDLTSVVCKTPLALKGLN